jgi:hypothetical protein
MLEYAFNTNVLHQVILLTDKFVRNRLITEYFGCHNLPDEEPLPIFHQTEIILGNNGRIVIIPKKTRVQKKKIRAQDSGNDQNRLFFHIIGISLDICTGKSPIRAQKNCAHLRHNLRTLQTFQKSNSEEHPKQYRTHREQHQDTN